MWGKDDQDLKIARESYLHKKIEQYVAYFWKMIEWLPHYISP